MYGQVTAMTAAVYEIMVAGPVVLCAAVHQHAAVPVRLTRCVLCLQELHDTATSANLKGAQGVAQVLGLFDSSLELWTGRIAMIGVAGLVAVETFTGKVLF